MRAGEVEKTLHGHRYGTQSGRDIITALCRPPIPDRRYDWCAYRDGDEERPHMVGWGSTEQEALADLRRLQQEQYEWEHETASLR